MRQLSCIEDSASIHGFIACFSRNQLCNIPPFICQLQRLEVLLACNNKLVSLPEEIGKLDRLMDLVSKGVLCSSILVSKGVLCSPMLDVWGVLQNVVPMSNIYKVLREPQAVFWPEEKDSSFFGGYLIEKSVSGPVWVKQEVDTNEWMQLKASKTQTQCRQL